MKRKAAKRLALCSCIANLIFDVLLMIFGELSLWLFYFAIVLICINCFSIVAIAKSGGNRRRRKKALGNSTARRNTRRVDLQNIAKKGVIKHGNN